MHRDWVPHAAEFLGTDIEGGEDVDVVADVHTLSAVVGAERFDVILSASTFEHLKYPGLAAHELLKTLTVGGLLFVQTHQSFPLHGYPRTTSASRARRWPACSARPWASRSSRPATTFPAQSTPVGSAARSATPAFLNTTLWGVKRAPTPADYRYEL